MIEPNPKLMEELNTAPYKNSIHDSAKNSLEIARNTITNDMDRPLKNITTIATLCACSGDVRGQMMTREDMYAFDAIMGRTMRTYNERQKARPEQAKALRCFNYSLINGEVQF